jgi:hypothetical protein
MVLPYFTAGVTLWDHFFFQFVIFSHIQCSWNNLTLKFITALVNLANIKFFFVVIVLGNFKTLNEFYVLDDSWTNHSLIQFNLVQSVKSQRFFLKNYEMT